jgi:hypothetical protein
VDEGHEEQDNRTRPGVHHRREVAFDVYPDGNNLVVVEKILLTIS